MFTYQVHPLPSPSQCTERVYWFDHAVGKIIERQPNHISTSSKFALLLHVPFSFTKLDVSTFYAPGLNDQVHILSGFPQSLKSPWILSFPWKWIFPWKVLEFRGPSLKFQLVVLDFLFFVFWTESLNGYSKFRGTRADFSPKKFCSLRSQQLTS